jgi:hypothetical protein
MLLLTSFLFVMGAVFCVMEMNEGCCGINKYKFQYSNVFMKLLIILLYIAELAVLIPLAIGVSAALTALVILPAYVF